jgi:hypothetical protein
LIINNPSCYDINAEFTISRTETFGTFLSRLQVKVQCLDNQLSVNSDDLVIKFHRTLRIPEDKQVHDLPADLALFPLQNLSPYIKKMRQSQNQSLVDMANKGGVFFPMFQREAMWISFKSKETFAIRVFVGGVNAISGMPWNAPKLTGKARQDYVVVPPQSWLDGITVGLDAVKQFVAMPIGAGYSIENQIIGEEKLGGVQLEITFFG